MGQPTMQDVADAAGVSRALVSLVMRGAPNVSDMRRTAVLEAADRLGYRPNVLARNLASRRTMTLGITVNDLHNLFFAETVDGIQAAAESRGYQTLITTGGPTDAGERGAIESLLRLRVDGLLLIGTRVPMDVITATARTTPTVLVGRPTDSDVLDSVNNDDAMGAFLAVRHLVELGHRSIAHLDGGDGAGAAARCEAYESAMRDAGLVDEIRIATGHFTESGGADAMDELLSSGTAPTAVFAGNDQMALGALDRLDDRGIEVPGDMSLVGYDNTSLAAINHISLTTINQPRVEMGHKGLELLVERLDGLRTDAVHHVMQPELVIRSTTATPSEPKGAS